MNKKICGIFFAVLISGAGIAAAEETDVQVLTIDDTVKLASENNITIKRSRLSLDLLKTKNKFSWNSVSPTASLRGSYSDDIEHAVTQYSITGSLNLALTPNLYTSIQGAKLNYENGVLSYEEACRSVELNVRKAFYGLLYEKENIELQKRNMETARSQYLQNQEKFRNGQISELDVMTSRVNYEQLKPAVEAAEVTFNNDLASFKQVIGIDQHVQVEISGSLDDVLSLKEIELPEMNDAAPGIKTSEKAVEIARNSVLSTKFSTYGPSVSAGWSYGSGKTSASDDWTVTNQLSLGVSIPLDGWLPWSTGAVNVDSAKTALEDAQLELENKKTSVAVEAESCLRKIRQAESQIDSLRANAALAKQTYDMTRTAYDYGKRDLLSLQNASDSLLSAEVSVKSQAYTLISAVLDLEDLLGIPFGTLGKTEENNNSNK